MDRRCFALLVLLALVACSNPPTAAPDSGTEPGVDAEVPLGDVTYYEDVRPILAQRCGSCHVAGGIGGFAFDSYETAAAIATRISQVTRDRIMPPYLANDSGECQDFRDSRWLSDRELDTLAAWDEQGEPMGDPATPEPEILPLPTLDGLVTRVDTGVDYAPDTTGPDDYRCFVVEAPFDTEYFLTGYEVHPGNAATVHHVIAFAPFDQAAVD
jgi:hypothetical protein